MFNKVKYGLVRFKKNNRLRLHDYCPNPNCKCQKQNTFTPKQFPHEGSRFSNTIKQIIKGSQKAWNSFPKPTFNTLAPVIGMAVGAKSKNPQVGQATTKILKNISGGKFFQ